LSKRSREGRQPLRPFWQEAQEGRKVKGESTWWKFDRAPSVRTRGQGGNPSNSSRWIGSSGEGGFVRGGGQKIWQNRGEDAGKVKESTTHPSLSVRKVEKYEENWSDKGGNQASRRSANKGKNIPSRLSQHQKKRRRKKDVDGDLHPVGGLG